LASRLARDINTRHETRRRRSCANGRNLGSFRGLAAIIAALGCIESAVETDGQ
jgi:hypothetical protein